MAADLVQQVHTSLQVVREMLVDRGVQADTLAFLDRFQTDELKVILETRPVFSMAIPDTAYALCYMVASRFKVSELRKHMEHNAPDFQDRTALLVVLDRLNVSDTKKVAEQGDFQVFTLRELQFNISRHQLVPKHELVTAEQEIQDILAQYDLKSKHQLPWILRSDPMARYLAAKPGQLVRVTRVSPTCGLLTVYRCCV